MSKKHYACDIYCYRVGKFVCCRHCTGFFFHTDEWQDCDRAGCFKDPATCNHGIPFDMEDCDFSDEEVSFEYGDITVYHSGGFHSSNTSTTGNLQ